jgi:hypothetical protein
MFRGPRPFLAACCVHQLVMFYNPQPQRCAMHANIAKSFNVLFVAAMSGCAPTASPPAPTLPMAAPVSYDGDYRGTISVTSTSSVISGAASNWCDTPPAISLSVQNNAFSYVLVRPNLPRDPNDRFSIAFAARVGPSGSFSTSSRNGEAVMTGSIAGSRMAGQIDGTGCSYAFAAEKA